MFDEERFNRARDDERARVREMIDEVVSKDLASVCEAIALQTRALFCLDARKKETLTTAVDAVLDRFQSTGNENGARAMFRYLMEGKVHSYQSESRPLMDFLKRNGFMGDADCELLDLGCGPGDLVRAWDTTYRRARGVDLSPTFVAANANLYFGLIDEEPDKFADALSGSFRPGLVVTSMTLDRVRNPRQLLSNVVHTARASNAKFVVSTILPLKPVDDDETAKSKITYTDDALRLTPGETVDEDRGIILAELRALAPEYEIDCKTVETPIASSHTTHTYTQYCFCGKPKEFSNV